MIGIKLWVGARANRPELDPIVKRAAELDALILQHTWIKQRGKGNLPQESTPMELAELSADGRRRLAHLVDFRGKGVRRLPL